LVLIALSLPVAMFGMIVFGLVHWNKQSDYLETEKKAKDSAVA